MFRRRHRQAATPVGRTRFERLLFSFMGPPQLGAHTAREGYTPDPSADLCHKCGQPWADHERVRTSNMTCTKCPT